METEVSGVMYDPQVYGLLGAALLLHLGTLVYVYLRRQRQQQSAGSMTTEGEAAVGNRTGRDAGPDIGGDVGSETEETIVCSECGTRNAADYRFCRACVTELAGRTARGGAEAFSNAA